MVLCDFKSYLSDFNLTHNSHNLHNSCTLHNLYGKVNFLKHIKKLVKHFCVYFMFICLCLFVNTEMFLKMKNDYWLSIEKNYSKIQKMKTDLFFIDSNKKLANIRLLVIVLENKINYHNDKINNL